MRSDVKSDVELAIAAVIEGMNVVRRSSGDRLQRIAKGQDDFATRADLDAEQSIRMVLSAGRPRDAIEGEEFGQSGDAAGEQARVWKVDPLCGTRNFASGAGDYCTNVALSIAGEPLVAAVGDPLRGHVYWTDGQSAQVRRNDGESVLHPSAQSSILELNADGPSDVIGPRLLGDRATRAWMSPRVSASTLALAWVASGRRAGYVSDGDLRQSVHFAAGIALCRGAGCIVSDLHGEDLRSGRGLLIAADARMHEEMCQRIRILSDS
jgi:myo-inositol-1(or 4)-monophosphatase